MRANRVIIFVTLLSLLLLTGCSSTVKLENWRAKILEAGYGECPFGYTNNGVWITVERYRVLVVISLKNIGDLSRSPFLALRPTLISPDGSYYAGDWIGEWNQSYDDCYLQLAPHINATFDPANSKRDYLPGDEEIIVATFELRYGTQLKGGEMFRLRVQEYDLLTNWSIWSGAPMVAEAIVKLPDIQFLDSP